MSDFQTALDNLRRDIQSDRQALQKSMDAGFLQINQRLDSHVDDHFQIENRLTAVQDRQTIIGRGLWGLFLAMIGTAASFLFGHKA